MAPLKGRDASQTCRWHVCSQSGEQAVLATRARLAAVRLTEGSVNPSASLCSAPFTRPPFVRFADISPAGGITLSGEACASTARTGEVPKTNNGLPRASAPTVSVRPCTGGRFVNRPYSLTPPRLPLAVILSASEGSSVALSARSFDCVRCAHFAQDDITYAPGIGGGTRPCTARAAEGVSPYGVEPT